MKTRNLQIALLLIIALLLAACSPAAGASEPQSTSPATSTEAESQPDSSAVEVEGDSPAETRLEPLRESYTDFWNAYTTPVEEENGIYKIHTAEELAWIADQVNDRTDPAHDIDGFKGKTIQLQNDIDLSGHNWVPIVVLTGYTRASDYIFKGTFDGNNYTIKYLTMAPFVEETVITTDEYGGSRYGGEDYVLIDDNYSGEPKEVCRSFGLFGRISEEAVIKNLTMAGSWQNGGFSSVGGIVVQNAGGRIQNCTNYADLTTTFTAGGICNSAYYTPQDGGIESCINYGIIRGEQPADEDNSVTIGGIVGTYSVVGSETYAFVRDCVNYGDVEGIGTMPKAAGIVGRLDNQWFDPNAIFVEQCVNFGNISAIGESTASAAGISYGFSMETDAGEQPLALFRECFNIGNVLAQAEECHASGIFHEAYLDTTYSLVNCGNTGAITANGTESYAGGITAQGDFSERFPAVSCYNAGEVTATYAGGIVGAGYLWGDDLHYLDSFPFSGEMPEGVSEGGTTHTAAEMQAEGFVRTLGSAWVMGNDQSKGYPILAFMQ